MNPRRIHDLMRSRFPAVNAAKREWTNVAGVAGPDVGALKSLMLELFSSLDVLVEVHRKEGALLPTEEAAVYIAAHVGSSEIRVADREFTSFMVVAANGVATGWQASANPSLQPTAFGRG
jgi:hypothetical protein